MKHLFLSAVMVLALAACENKTEKREEIKAGTDVTQPATMEKVPADSTTPPADTTVPADSTTPAQ